MVPGSPEYKTIAVCTYVNLEYSSNVQGTMDTSIPVYVIACNNVTYVSEMVNALLCRKVSSDIRVVDNGSTYCPMLGYLAFLERLGGSVTVIRLPENRGPHVVYTLPDLPVRYALTDPDLLLPPAVNEHTLSLLAALADKYHAHKVGFALDISEPQKLRQGVYFAGQTIAAWESVYWTAETCTLEDGSPVYFASIDTTFAVHTSTNVAGPSLRVAGAYTCRHLPWYLPGCLPLGAPLPYEEEVKHYTELSKGYSTTARLCLSDATEALYSKQVTRNGVTFQLFTKPDCSANIAFLHHAWPTWELDTFGVLDDFLAPGKGFVDIGAWIGPMTLYAARKCGHVIAVEADPIALRCLFAGIAANSVGNVHVVSQAVFNATGWVCLRKNAFLANSKLGDSTSQVLLGSVADAPISEDYVRCICIADLERQGVFDNASIVKVDIEGAEQTVGCELLRTCAARRLPLFMSFHLPWWSKIGGACTFDEFATLSGELYPDVCLESLKANPFGSILFTSK